MPEVGNMALPTKLLRMGIKDMLRISDARMSGTAFGSIILHVSPEAANGGTFSILRTGDIIEFDGHARTLNVRLDDAEIQTRLRDFQASSYTPVVKRGYAKLHIEHVLQADQGADLDFLVGHSGHLVTRESH